MKHPEIAHVTKYRNGDRRYWMVVDGYALSIFFPKSSGLKPKEMRKIAMERISIKEQP